MTVADVVAQVVSATSWDRRVALIRQIPENFGTASRPAIFAEIARQFYVPTLAPDFAFVHWREEYELEPFQAAYGQAVELTGGFQRTGPEDIAGTLEAAPSTLSVFRLLLGFTAQEFAASTVLADAEGKGLTTSTVKRMEAGGKLRRGAASICARTIDLAMRGELFKAPQSPDLRLKTAKPDSERGWATVRHYCEDGVPLSVFLHQRLYGGAFRQLLDATSTKRGNLLEDAVMELFDSGQIPYIRTGSNNQEEIARRFSLTVKPAPDFVVFDSTGTLRAILECKGANDGGTARDKAARFSALRTEATRLGGVPVFAILAGLGWTRASDALGPVIQHTDGRVFTIPTLHQMMGVQPFPQIGPTQF